MKLDEIVNQGHRKYGKGTFTVGYSTANDFPRIPTGIFAIDYAIGGGFPIGVTSQVYGPPGGGKTLVTTRAAAGAQNICWHCFEYLWDCKCGNKEERKVVWVTTELFDLDWSIQLGIDPDKMVVVEPDSGEQAIDIMAECLRSEDCGLVVLDSLAMLTPEEELTASASDVQVGLQARMIGKMIRRIKTIMIREKKRNHQVAFLATNQVRAKIGGFAGRGPSEEVPGGFTSKHDWHLTFRMSQISSDDKDKETDLPINAKFKASMAAMGNKRKVMTLSGSAEFMVTVSNGGEYVKGTVNDYRTVTKYADSTGLLSKDWVFDGKRYKTKGEFLDTWNDLEVFLSTKKKIIDYCVSEARKQQDGGIITDDL